MIKTGIIGGGGYVAGELIRCLVNHPHVQIDFIYSNSQHGKKVADVHEDMYTHPELTFSNKIKEDVDVVFICLGHGNSGKFLAENTFSKATKIIDLSNDFRLINDANGFIYGLPELNKSEIKSATKIANPGCFATAIQLALLPLADGGLLKNDVHVNAITGSTGAGQSPSATTHFSWRNNNISVYKAFRHQHLDEIKESVNSLQSDFSHSIDFLPHRGDFTRGIHATMYTKSSLSEPQLIDLFKAFYKDAKFTFISDNPINLKQVVNTNNCLIHVQKIEDKVLVTSVIDNLLKGAAGQAIQNMNLMFGIEETTGVKFKANYF
jgi:N-acetyl-gamma-glutamyl-phosphate reductase